MINFYLKIIKVLIINIRTVEFKRSASLKFYYVFKVSMKLRVNNHPFES